jgi:cytochrome c oxidase cbb3-type subunit 4
MSYDALRHLADSWGLVFLGATFLVLTGWTFRRGASTHHDRAANQIFDEDETHG